MLKIRILSDLHLEFDPGHKHIDCGEDIILCAGDMGSVRSRDNALLYIKRAAKPFYYIVGNHDFYHGEWSEVFKFWSSVDLPNFHFLHNTAIDLGTHTLLGTPLFTDFKLYETPAVSMKEARKYINDFRLVIDGKDNLRPERYAKEFAVAYNFLDVAITEATKPVIVMTHWCPSHDTVSKEYLGDAINPFFTSECRILMREPVKVWIHGHSHTEYRGKINGVDVIRHPKGYPHERYDYKPMVIEI